MTTTLELNDDQLYRLLTVLNENEDAIEPEDSVRWTSDSASQIGSLREAITEQLE